MLIRLYIFGFLKRFVIYQPIILIFYQSQGLSYTQIQSLGAVYFFSILIFEIPTGMAADLYSYKWSLVMSSLCMLICRLLIAFGGTFPLYIAAQVFNGIGYAFFSGCFSALFYETVRDGYGEALYTRKYSVNYNVGIMGAVSAYILCSLITAYYGTAPTLILTCVFTGVTLIMSFFLPDNKKKPDIKNRSMKENVIRFISLTAGLRKNRELFFLALNGLAVGVLVHLALKFLPFHMKVSTVNESFFGYIETVTLIVSLVTLKYIFRPMENGRNRMYISVSVQMLMFLSFLVFGLWFNPFVSVLNVVIFQTLHEIFHSMYDIEYNERIDHEMRATFLSAFSFFMSLFYAVLSPPSGALADNYGLSSAFIIFSVLNFLVLIPFLLQRIRTLVWNGTGPPQSITKEKTS